MKRLLLTLALAALTGCASVHQTSNLTETDPKTGIVTERKLESRILASGNSRQTVEALKLQASSKTSSIGVTGAGQESSQADFIAAVGALMKDMGSMARDVSAAMAAAASAPRSSVSTSATNTPAAK